MPAGIERGDATSGTGAGERARLRWRLRELRRLREAQLLELGALVMEAHRLDRDDLPVIKDKLAEAAATDAEARALAEALGTDAGVDTIVAAGIAGPCPTCGTLASTSARFCSTCGTALDGRPDPAARVGPKQDEAPAADPAHDGTADVPGANGRGAAPEKLEPTGGREA